MITDKDLAIAAKMMDFYALRHKVMAHNVANAGVPGYRKLDVPFQEALLEAIRSGDPEAIRKAAFRVEQSATPGVDRETEVARMTKNELLFDAFAQVAAHKLRLLRMAVTSK